MFLAAWTYIHAPVGSLFDAGEYIEPTRALNVAICDVLAQSLYRIFTIS
jgi:hypothetical protein